MSDLMLIGVLRMPMDDAGPLDVFQYVARGRQAADRIEADAAEIERLRAQVAALEVDAGRYRLIREEMSIERGIDSKGKRGLMAWWTGIGVESGSDEHIDAAIDAALAARKGEA